MSLCSTRRRRAIPHPHWTHPVARRDPPARKVDEDSIGSASLRLNLDGRFLILPLLAAISATSQAQDADPLHFFVGQGITFDSNLFRLPDGANPDPGATGVSNPTRAETVFNTYAAVGFDRLYSRQRVRADFTFAHYRYRTYRYLDFNGISGRAAWDWAIGDRWKGRLGYDRTQSPSNYATQVGFRTSYQLYQRVVADANYWWHPDWSAGAGLSRVTNDHNNSISAFSDYDADVADARITFRPRSGNEVRVLVRRTNGNYPNRFASPGGFLAQPYTQDDFEAEARWVLSGHSRVDGRLGYSSLRYGATPSGPGGFEGPTARLAYDWTPTGKTKVTLVLRHDIGPEPQNSLDASFVETSAASVAASWAVTSKISLRALAELRRRALGGEPRVPDSALRNPTRTQVYTLAGTWTPVRSVLLGVTAEHERRTGNNSAYPNYDDTRISADLRLLF